MIFFCQHYKTQIRATQYGIWQPHEACCSCEFYIRISFELNCVLCVDREEKENNVVAVASYLMPLFLFYILKDMWEQKNKNEKKKNPGKENQKTRYSHWNKLKVQRNEINQ
jgi:hypothetical protein